jgi:hypothetical protein
MITIPKDLCCVFCSKQIKSVSSYRQHYVRCKDNPNKIECKPGMGMLGKTGWNKGLTKETDERVRINSENAAKVMRKQYAEGIRKIKPMSKENRRKLSERQSLFNTGGKSKWYSVAGQKVQGTYEKKFAESLEEQNIRWEKIKTNNHIFSYISDNKEKTYAPDFWLPELSVYVEIKGYWWGDDENKMRTVKNFHQDKNVIIIYGKEKLNYICEDITNNLPLEPVWSW